MKKLTTSLTAIGSFFKLPLLPALFVRQLLNASFLVVTTPSANIHSFSVIITGLSLHPFAATPLVILPSVEKYLINFR